MVQGARWDAKNRKRILKGNKMTDRTIKRYHFFESVVYAECFDGTVWLFEVEKRERIFQDVNGITRKIVNDDGGWQQLPEVPGSEPKNAVAWGKAGVGNPGDPFDKCPECGKYPLRKKTDGFHEMISDEEARLWFWSEEVHKCGEKPMKIHELLPLEPPIVTTVGEAKERYGMDFSKLVAGASPPVVVSPFKPNHCPKCGEVTATTDDGRHWDDWVTEHACKSTRLYDGACHGCGRIITDSPDEYCGDCRAVLPRPHPPL